MIYAVGMNFLTGCVSTIEALYIVVDPGVSACSPATQSPRDTDRGDLSPDNAFFKKIYIYVCEMGQDLIQCFKNSI